MKSPNKENLYINNNSYYYNKKIISNENSKNEDLDIKEKNNEKRNQKEITLIK